MADGISVWVPVISVLAGSVLTGTIQFFMNRQNHLFALEREQKATADRLLNEKQAAEDELQKERHFIATELVFMLEQFAESCADVATDDGEENDDPQPVKEAVAVFPVMDLKDVSGNWRVLPPRLMYRIHEIPVLLSEARMFIEHARETDDSGEYRDFFRERRYQSARLGLKAIILAKRLRKLAKFPGTRLDALPWSAQPVLWDVWRNERRRRAAEAFENRDFSDTEFVEMAP